METAADRCSVARTCVGEGGGGSNNLPPPHAVDPGRTSSPGELYLEWSGVPGRPRADRGQRKARGVVRGTRTPRGTIRPIVHGQSAAQATLSGAQPQSVRHSPLLRPLLLSSALLYLLLLTSYQGEPGSIPGRFTLDFRKWGAVPDDAAGRRVDIPLPPPFHSGASPCPAHFALIGSRDIAVKSRPDIFTLKAPFRRDDFKVTVAERLACSPPTQANLVQYPAGSTDFRKWESWRTMTLVGGFSRVSPASLAPSFQSLTMLT
ncbi:hypothetical protein PR048_017007 [Dryococelus australis]|uniref:Uncharacterized protein n=1 Tax=Dryococelus australis TaxID=614101 RepID=A0ABQ9H8D6_9NEOP|nr:hypothetical protein PR048_017007 [Dryococelus australis]